MKLVPHDNGANLMIEFSNDFKTSIVSINTEKCIIQTHELEQLIRDAITNEPIYANDPNYPIKIHTTNENSIILSINMEKVIINVDTFTSLWLEIIKAYNTGTKIYDEMQSRVHNGLLLPESIQDKFYIFEVYKLFEKYRNENLKEIYHHLDWYYDHGLSKILTKIFVINAYIMSFISKIENLFGSTRIDDKYGEGQYRCIMDKVFKNSPYKTPTT